MEESDKTKRVRPPAFKLEIPGNIGVKQSIMSKLQQVRTKLVSKLQKPVNNADILETVLDSWLKQPGANHEIPGLSTVTELCENETGQDMYVIAKSSLGTLLNMSQVHAHSCPGKLQTRKIHCRGHVAVCKISCPRKHQYWWASSPQLPNGKYLINERIEHALVCSGMLPVHYQRFVKGAGMGFISKTERMKHFSVYKHAVHQEYNDLIGSALLCEIAGYECNKNWQGIDIMTDARHGWRKNAKDSSIVAIGDKSHQVLHHVHITKEDDHCSQRHEKLGTEKVYTYLDSQDVSVAVHAHDRNTSINKFVREKQPLTRNQNDTWHSVKSLKKELSKIGAGPKKLKGKTWHWQLEDKAEPVATHAHWAIRNCNGSAELLQEKLLNIVEHYKNRHDMCDSSSRCRRDPKYEPSRLVITDPVAERLLTNAITKAVIYRSAGDYVLGKDTYLVESFNNVMNIFHDKRIAFSDDQYLVRSHLAVCHWNENSDRGYTSIWKPKLNPRAPRSQKGKKILKPCTYLYRNKIWNRHIKSMFKK